VNICSDLFDVPAVYVLDPTFLLEITDYEDLIQSDTVKTPSRKYVSFFTLDQDLEDNISNSPSVQNFIKKANLDLINIRGDLCDVLNEKKFIYNTIPQWLNYIKNSELIITDSYHGVIFSLLFKKEFVVIQRDYAGNERLNSLFSVLNIKNRFFKNLNDIKFNRLNINKINYAMVSKQINIEKKRSADYLKNSLNTKTNTTINNIEEALINEKEIRLKIEQDLIQEKVNRANVEEQYKTLQIMNQKTEEAYNAWLNSKTYKYAKEALNILHILKIKL